MLMSTPGQILLMWKGSCCAVILLPPSSKKVSEGLMVFAIVPGINLAHICAILSSVSVNWASIDDLRRRVADSLVMSGKGSVVVSPFPFGFNGIALIGAIIAGTAYAGSLV